MVVLTLVLTNLLWAFLFLRQHKHKDYAARGVAAMAGVPWPQDHFSDARRIVTTWPKWKRNIGHRLDP